MRTLFELRDVSITAAGAAAPELDRFSLSMTAGEAVVLLGEAGCGKDAVLRLLGNALARSDEASGTIRFGESDALAVARRPRNPLQIAHLPPAAQHPLSPRARVTSQLVRVIAHRLRCPSGAAREELHLALQRLPGAPAFAALERLPDELDAVALSWALLAAALAVTPELVLCDHAFADLTPVAAGALTCALRDAQRTFGFAILYSARIPQVVARLRGRTIVLQRGRVVEEGEAEHMLGGQTHSYTRALFDALPRPEPDKPRRSSRGEPLLQVQGLSLQADRKKPPRARDTISFELRRGAALALVGEDGSGRHQLARAVLGLDRRPGRVLFDAVDLNLLSEPMMSRLRRRIAFVTSADGALDPRMTLWDAVDEPLRAYLKISRELTAGYREAALKRVGLASHDGRRAIATLPPFDHRRLQIARAIVAAPLLVVVDEPLRGLDAIARATIRDLLAEFRVEQQAALLVITGDFAVARAFADDVLVFADGHVIERGPVRELLRSGKEGATRTLIEAAGFGGLSCVAEAV
jgi:ABC-type glutathione transport system ATPase component